MCLFNTVKPPKTKPQVTRKKSLFDIFSSIYGILSTWTMDILSLREDFVIDKFHFHVIYCISMERYRILCFALFMIMDLTTLGWSLICLSLSDFNMSCIWFFNDFRHKYYHNSMPKHRIKLINILKLSSKDYITNIENIFDILDQLMSLSHDWSSIHMVVHITFELLW